MFDELSRELEFFRKMRALIKQAEVEARLAGSHMGETERPPVDPAWPVVEGDRDDEREPVLH